MSISKDLFGHCNYKEITDNICSFISGYVERSQANGIMIGISGGLDSAVLAFLGLKALGPGKTNGIFLPDRDTAIESYRHAEIVAAAAGIKLETRELTPTLTEMGCYKNIIVRFAKNGMINRNGFKAFRRIMNKDLYEFNLKGSKNRVIKQAMESYYLRYRTRMKILYKESRKLGLVLPDSLNKTENKMGFTTYEDITVDCAPLLSLYKSQVRGLAEHLGVPLDIIKKPPSPDLFPGITDETFLDISYPQLDSILYLLEKGYSKQIIAYENGINVKKVKRIERLVTLASQLNSKLDLPCPIIECD